MASHDDRRSASRIRVRVPVDYETERGNGQGFTYDVSLAGVRVESATEEVHFGEKLQLRFSGVMGSHDRVFEASVTRSTGPEFAARFSSADTTRDVLAEIFPSLRGTTRP